MIGGIDDGTTAALVGVLEDGEQILGALSSVGAALVLTDRRMTIVRDGWRHRPKSGISGIGIQPFRGALVAPSSSRAAGVDDLLCRRA